jgi:hypothetical protein
VAALAAATNALARISRRRGELISVSRAFLNVLGTVAPIWLNWRSRDVLLIARNLSAGEPSPRSASGWGAV